MANSFKAFVIRENLAEKFTIRLPSLAKTKGQDSSNLPTLLIGAGTAGSQSAFIRVKQFDTLAVDVLGLAQDVFTPHVIQVVLETSTIANVPLMTIDNLTILMAEILARGTRVEVYLSANTNVPDATDITAGNLKQTWEPHEQYPTLATM